MELFIAFFIIDFLTLIAFFITACLMLYHEYRGK